MNEISTPTAGIDTAKHRLDIALHGSARRWWVANDPPGWRRLAEDLRGAGVARVGIEATGGYERGVVLALRAAGSRSWSCSRCRCAPSPGCVAAGPRTTASTRF